MRDSDDVIAEIEADHRRIEALIDRLGEGDRPLPADPARELGELLARHAAAEQAVVDPVLRSLGGGVGLAARGRAEHVAIDAALGRLALRLKGGTGTTMAVRALRDAVTGHFREEEVTVLSALRTGVGGEELQHLAERFRDISRA